MSPVSPLRLTHAERARIWRTVFATPLAPEMVPADLASAVPVVLCALPPPATRSSLPVRMPCPAVDELQWTWLGRLGSDSDLRINKDEEGKSSTELDSYIRHDAAQDRVTWSLTRREHRSH